MANQQPNQPRNDQRASGAPQLSKERAEYLSEQYGYTPQQVNVVRNAICVGATDEELEFFLATCKRLALDPFARQIWFVKRKQRVEDSQGNVSWIDVGRPETSIDGFRTIAERSGEYEGQAPIEWCGKDGKWCDVWLKEEAPFAARAKVYRTKLREPIVTVALLTEYRPTYKNGDFPAMWKKMPANQLGVRAEAQAFRKAFPRDLSGIVIDGEGEAMEITNGYSAPAKPEPVKQIEQRKPDVAAKIVDTVATEQREPATVPIASAPTTSEPAHDTPTEPEPGSDDDETELDREMAAQLKGLTAAKDRESLRPWGLMITEAKKQIAANATNAHARAVIDVLVPAFNKRWRETK